MRLSHVLFGRFLQKDSVMVQQRKSGELLRQTAIHPLGRITFAGFFIDERAVGPTPMRFWDTYAVVYLLKGKARYYDEAGLNLPMRPGDFLLMFPGHGYHYDVDPRFPWSEFALHFQGPVFDLWWQLKIIDPSRPIYRLKPIEKWLKRFEELVQPHRNRRPNNILKQVCQWQEILADVLVEGRIPKKEYTQSLWLGQATTILDGLPVDKPIDWPMVAGQMGLSYDRFRKKFVQSAGTPPAKYFMARRLESACQMLEDRKLGLKEIAYACGFCDAFQFSKQFKKGLRLTPSEYRNFKLHGP
jgi:AraC-like DNA-binding protein